MAVAKVDESERRMAIPWTLGVLTVWALIWITAARVAATSAAHRTATVSTTQP